jgi:hypothetical protein
MTEDLQSDLKSGQCFVKKGIPAMQGIRRTGVFPVCEKSLALAVSERAER